ncbi:MAG: nucleotidyltransferase domain-containing protein [Methanophagales archaeon ANME-1-THS]|nr:MAG: nucleotidyltransferase domain-containing protein [Methanophagales archaeon ANME-1-THS]
MVELRSENTGTVFRTPPQEYRAYTDLIVTLLNRSLGENLVSVVLFGSVARGEAGEGSDIDLLIVAKNFEPFKSRFDVFNKLEWDLKTSKAYRDLKEKKLGTLISPIPHTPEEIKRNPPILLDIITDGIILYDTDNFMSLHLKELRKKLVKLGARKIFLGNGRWYWDLKPDYRLHEVVEL